MTLKTITENIAKKATEKELTEEEIQTYITTALNAVKTEGLEKASGVVVDKLRQQIAEMISQENEQQTEFEERLYARWKKALDLYDATLLLTRECGEIYLKQYIEQASKDNDLVFGVLMHCHFKACQVASAISVLLKSGYASDALSRQRTLHELAVTMFFVKKHGPEIAEQYWVHNAIESHKAALQYQEYHKRINHKPFDPSELEALRVKKEELVNRFGKVYAEQYGWAAKALGKSKLVQFSDIEKDVGFDHMRPYYRMASHGVHANPKGLVFNIGNIYGSENKGKIIPLSGASNAGLADPGELALISLHQCSTVFMTVKNDFDTLLQLKVLNHFVKEGCQAFNDTHWELVREEEGRNKAKDK